MSSRVHVCLHALGIFIALAAVLTGVLGWVGLQEINAARTTLRNNEATEVAARTGQIDGLIDGAINHLRLLLPQPELARWLDDDTPQSRAPLAQEFATLLNGVNVYDRLRLIDERGMEVVRVQRDNGSAIVLPDELLQDKSQRPYVQAAMQLPPGQFHISPMDLRIEHGKVELPEQTVVRFAAPLFNAAGHRRGCLVLSMAGSHILDLVGADAHHTHVCRWMLIDDRGLLISGEGSDAAGRDHEGRRLAFEGEQSHLWRTIRDADRGMVEAGGRMYIFDTIAIAGRWSSTAQPAQTAWKLVSVVSTQALSATIDQIIWTKAAVLLAMLAPLAGVSWLVAAGAGHRREAIRQLQHSERKLLAIADAACDAVILVNDLGLIRFWNPAAERIYGYRADEVLGRNAVEVMFCKPDRDRYRDQLAAMARTAEHSLFNQPQRVAALTRDGEQTPVELSASPVCYADQSSIVLMVRDITERLRFEQQLDDSRQFLHNLVENIPVAVFVKDALDDFKFTLWNKAAEEIFGLPRRRLLGKTDYSLFPREQADAYRAVDRRTVLGGEVIDVPEEIGWHSRKGRICLHTRKSPLVNAQGIATHLLVICEDITAQKEAQKRLLLTQKSVDHSSDAVYWIDECAQFIYVNDAACQHLGYTSQELLQMTVFDIDEGVTETWWRNHWDNFPQGGATRFERTHVRRDGSRCPVEISSRRIVFGDTMIAVAISRDLTQQKLVEEQLRRAAETDGLTSLPNRAHLHELLRRAIARRQADSDHGYALFFLDCDRFKIINDSLGHEVGDRLLMEIAYRLQPTKLNDGVGSDAALVGPDCQAVAARLGGDEFVVLIEGRLDTQRTRAVAQRLLDRLSRPCDIGSHRIHPTMSVGVTTSDEDHARPEEALRDADTALYAAKAAGRGCFVMFDRSMFAQAQRRQILEHELRQAIDNSSISVVYQPLVCLQTGKLHGFEALARWTHPTLGGISPAEFIPIAEETGLILRLGELVLVRSCQQLARWQRELGLRGQLAMNVNVSRIQLMQAEFCHVVERAVAAAGILPGDLHLEITESAIMRDQSSALEALGRLRKLGVELHIDDFGTGYSSLSCLHRFPLQGLKIDRTFVSTMGARPDYAAVVQAIVTLAHNLNMQVTAEGVEHFEQIVELQALDCDFAQGYHFAKPLSTDDAQRFIEERLASQTQPV